MSSGAGRTASRPQRARRPPVRQCLAASRRCTIDADILPGDGHIQGSSDRAGGTTGSSPGRGRRGEDTIPELGRDLLLIDICWHAKGPDESPIGALDLVETRLHLHQVGCTSPHRFDQGTWRRPGSPAPPCRFVHRDPTDALLACASSAGLASPRTRRRSDGVSALLTSQSSRSAFLSSRLPRYPPGEPAVDE